MADEAIAQFTSITSATPGIATQYLSVTDNNVEQAIQLYFESGGVDLGGALPTEAAAQSSTAISQSDPIPIDDSNDVDMESRNLHTGSHPVEDDEAMARRLQNEMYSSIGGGGGGGSLQQEGIDPETGVRAPMARTTETLAGPGADWQNDPEEMRAAIAEQMMNRRQRRQQGM